MRVYVSSHTIDRARELAAALEAAGHAVTSTWHAGDGPMPRGIAGISPLDFVATAGAADDDVAAIRGSSVLVLVAAPDGTQTPSGEFVEAGVAIGAGLPVVVVGRRENRLLYAEPVYPVATDAEAIRRIGNLEAMRAAAPPACLPGDTSGLVAGAGPLPVADFVAALDALALRVFAASVAKGFHPAGYTPAVRDALLPRWLGLIVSEASEALAEHRKAAD